MTSTTTPQPSLGSDSWTGGAAYNQDDEFRNRIDAFHSAFSACALLSRASQLRGGMLCSLTPKFAVGSFNYVRQITFDDGVRWIARLRMPSLGSERGTDVLYQLKSEVHTMEFLLANTDIPIPKLHDYNLEHNPVGAPYLLMDYVHGNTAEEVAGAQEFVDAAPSIREKYFEKFWRQVANIVVELAAVRFPKIGSIIKQDGSFTIGRLADTATGPYSTAKELYDRYPKDLSKSLFANDEDFMGLPTIFRDYMARRIKNPASREDQSFGLVNLDIGPHNVLVDTEFNVLALIDLDSVVAYPKALLHQFPMFSDMDDLIPGETKIHPSVHGRRERARRFARYVGEAQAKRILERGGEAVLTTDSFYSTELIAFRAMSGLKTKQHWVIDDWKRALRFLDEPKDDAIR